VSRRRWPRGGDRDAERLLPSRGHGRWSVGPLAAALAFLAAIALAVALAAGQLEAEWGAALAEDATLQIVAPEAEMEPQARAALEVLRAAEGVRSVRVVDVEEQRALLRPWIGDDLAIDELPLPLLIAVEIDHGAFDEAALTRRLAAEAPGAVFDDHAAWRTPLVESAARVRLFALACLGLLALALAAVAALATGGAVAADGQAVRTLRLVGARDRFITAGCTRRMTRRAALGALVGTVAAMALLWLVPAGSEPGFFLAGVGPAGWHRAVPLVIPPAAGLVAWAASRRAARRVVRRWS
jgi:cell division transport system permease protein